MCTVGFHMKIGSESLFGTHARVIKEDSSRKLGAYVSMLQHSADECQRNGVIRTNMYLCCKIGEPKFVMLNIAILSSK